jgi:hypothetical protein
MAFLICGDVRMKKWIAGCVVLAVVFGGLKALRAADDLTIKDVMDKAHKPAAKGKPTLLQKAISAKGTAEDKKMLLELYEALGKNKPPKGDEDDWKKRTDAIVAAAKDLVDGGKGAAGKLTKAANCNACHKAHKA